MEILKNVINSVNREVRNLIKNIKIIINNMKKNIKNIIIWSLLTIVAIGGVTYVINIPIEYNTNEMMEYKEYIVNKRSLKIHINNCSSVNKMSNKNKMIVNNSLENLIGNGYYICNRCKAGVKRKHEAIASFLENIEDVLFGKEDISFKTYDEYLDSIDEMGKWYVSHVASYEGILFEKIATEDAVNYYKNNKITKRGKLLCYPCENLKLCTGEYTKAGDDCVRFIFSCLNNMDNKFINNLTKISKIKWSSISSKNLNTKENELQYAMINLGFEIYDINPKKVDLNFDGYYDFEILAIDNNFELKKGDILSRDGHVHVYLNDNENFGWGKVNNVYPNKTYTYIDKKTNNIVCNGESFNRVYRYIGEN